MRGDKSALFIEIIFQPKRNDPCVVPRNPSAKRARQPHPAKNPHLPNQTQNLPHVPAALQKRNKSSLSKRRGHGGSSGKMREVWREKKPHPKGGSFSLQGLSPFPFSPTHAPLQTPSRGKWGSWGSECRARRARGRRSTRQAPVNPSHGKALQPSEETEATGAGARQNPRET